MSTTQPQGTECHASRQVEDVKLIERVKEGDTAALARLYDRYKASVRATLQRIVGFAEADDLVHEVFLCVWLRAKSYTPGRADVAAWITWLARNKAIDITRRAKRHALAVADLEHELSGPPST